MKFTIVVLLSALATVSTAEFCDSGAAGVGACENIDKNTFCVGNGCIFLCFASLKLTSGRHSAWTIRVMHFRLSGTAWQIPRARFVQVGHGQNAAEILMCMFRKTIFDHMENLEDSHKDYISRHFIIPISLLIPSHSTKRLVGSQQEAS